MSFWLFKNAFGLYNHLSACASYVAWCARLCLVFKVVFSVAFVLLVSSEVVFEGLSWPLAMIHAFLSRLFVFIHTSLIYLSLLSHCCSLLSHFRYSPLI